MSAVVVTGNLSCLGASKCQIQCWIWQLQQNLFLWCLQATRTSLWQEGALSPSGEIGWFHLENSTVRGREQPGRLRAPGRRKLICSCQVRMICRVLAVWLEKVAAKFIFDPERCPFLQLCRDCTCELMKATSVVCDSSLSVLLCTLREKYWASRAAIHKAH